MFKVDYIRKPTRPLGASWVIDHGSLAEGRKPLALGKLVAQFFTKRPGPRPLSKDLGTMPWLTGAGGALDFDCATMGDGLSQAMDMTFAGVGTGPGMTGMGMDVGGWGSNLMSGEGWLDQLQFQF